MRGPTSSSSRRSRSRSAASATARPTFQQSEAAATYVDDLNKRLLTELQLDGRVLPSNAVVHGRFALRACITNIRTEAEDLDALLDVAAELGQRLDDELRPESLRSQAS